MSSDSEDDCYGNIAQKLQSMKNKYSEDKIETTNLLIADLKEKTDNSWRKNDSMSSGKDCDLSQNSEDFSLDAIIAKNSSKRATRASKRVAEVISNLLPEKVTRKKRTKKSDETDSQTDTQSAANCTIASTSVLDSTTNSIVADQSALDSTNADGTSATRGRGRGRGRARQVTPRRGRGRQPTIPNLVNTNPRAGGRSQPRARGRGRSPRAPSRRSYWSANELSDPALFDFAAALAASMAMVSGPVYSVGNTDEYPDQCDNQPLFSNIPKPASDIVVVEEESEENEELSVKVYWQSSEHVKFNIRRFEKLIQIFDHFSKRENVSRDKLFFTYNDKILKSSDTPDSIGYSIAKFIDGGVINQSVSSIVNNVGEDDGIKLKFQCQNVKKPIVLSIDPDDKLLVVMMKCAEHLEKPLEKLKFYFDGDLISGNHTTKELDLEGGECVDVRVIS